MKNINAAELAAAQQYGRNVGHSDGWLYNRAGIVRIVCRTAKTTMPSRDSVRWEQIISAVADAAREVRQAARHEKQVLGDLERAFQA